MRFAALTASYVLKLYVPRAQPWPYPGYLLVVEPSRCRRRAGSGLLILAIVYSLMIWHDAGQQGITTSVQGGNHNYLYENLYVTFVQNGNMDALMNGITNHLRNNTAYPSNFGSDWERLYGP